MNKILTYISVFFIFCGVCTVGFYVLYQPDEDNRPLGSIQPVIHMSDINQAYEEMVYTFQSPFVRLNPFGRNPLTALIKFPTEEDAEISILIQGKTTAGDIKHTFKGFKKEHTIPVFGLYAGFRNTVVLTACFKNKLCDTTQVQIDTPRVPKRSLLVIQKPSDNPVTRYHYVLEGIVFDELGDMRFDFETNRMVYWFNGELIEETRNVGLTRYSMLGEKMKDYPFPVDFISFSHGIGQKPNGNFLVIGSFKNKKALFENQWQPTQRDFVIEMDYHTGQVVQTYDFSDILNPDRSVIIRSNKMNYGINNWCHMNAVDYDRQDDSIVISCKHMGMIKADAKTGALTWLFGPAVGFDKSGRNGQGKALYDRILTAVDGQGKALSDDFQRGMVRDKSFKWPTKTHHAKVLGNGLFSIYDNSGTLYRSDIVSSSTSYASIFEVNPDTLTVRQVFQKNLGVFSEVAGSVLYNQAHQDVTVFSAQVKDPAQEGISSGILVRYDFKTGQELFKAVLYRGGESYFYRIDDFEFYPKTAD